MPARDEDSHDVLGTFYIVSNRAEMQRVPRSGDELIYLLQSRHRVLLSARLHKQPGMFKTENNRTGNTYFVDYNLVRGTLMKGFEFYQALQKPFTRAVFMMFMISEVHPFPDGNGRIARIVMNAELTSTGESKIIIPTVFREDYLLALRRLSSQNDPNVFIHAMQKVRKFSHHLYGEGAGEMERFLNKCDAFEEPNEGVLRMDF